MSKFKPEVNNKNNTKIDFHQEYSIFHKKCESVNLKVIEDHVQDILIIEEILGFQNWLNNQVAAVYNENQTYARKQFSEASVQGLFALNFLSLYSSFITVQQNLIHQTISNIRTIYESIPKMYYISFYPNDCGKIILREYIEGKNYDESKNILRSSSVKEIFKIYNLEFSEGLLTELRKKYDSKWVRNKIYSTDQLAKLKSTFSLFSTSSHGSISRVANMQGYSKEMIGDIFHLIKFLSFFNITAELNGHRNMIEEKFFPFNETTIFLEGLRKKLVDKDGNMSSLFPDNPNIIDKLICSPDSGPWNRK